MIILGGDIETTGLEPGDHRMVEIYLGHWDLTSRKLVKKFYTRLDPQRSIPIETQRVHGISLADVEGCPTWNVVAPRVRDMLDEADVVVGHNWKKFDGPFINYELERVGLEPIDKPIVDTMLNGRWATANGAIPNLGALCFATDIPYDTEKAHAADYDVGVMMDAFFRGLDWGWFRLPEGMEVARAEAA